MPPLRLTLLEVRSRRVVPTALVTFVIILEVF